MTATTIPDLISRMERAEGASRIFDAELTVLFDVRPEWAIGYGHELFIERQAAHTVFEPVIRINSTGGKQSNGHPPLGFYERYTASLDAALSLVERVLPDAHFHLESIGAPRSRYEAAVLTWIGEDGPFIGFGGVSSTPALALCIALLKAIQVKVSQ